MKVESLTDMFQEDLYYFTTPVAVVLKKAWESYSSQEQHLLQKILTSVKTDINAIQIITAPSVKLGSLVSFSPSRVLIFGSDTGEDMVSYKAMAAHGLTAIRADDLSELNEERKKDLWMGLRQMFGL